MSLLRRGDDVSLEDERDALRRQRAEGAAEIEGLKRTLAERVQFVQMKERELDEALRRAERQGGGRPVRPPSGSGASSAELTRRENELAARERVAVARASELDARAAELAAQEAELASRPKSEREIDWEAREADLARREAELAAASERLARIDERLEELKAAEVAFVKTQAELAARSDELAERERALATREKESAGRNGDEPDRASAIDVEALETRIRRLEQTGGGNRPPSFSAGLKDLETRGLRGKPEAPLH